MTAGRRWSRGWAWTPDEDRILAAHYPAGGSTAAQAALEAAGFPPRTVNALNRRAFTLGLRTGRRPPAPVGPVEAWTAATHAVRSFRGLPATLAELERFEAGELAQVVWPHLSADDREFLVTGITPEEERNLLPPEDEEAWGC